MDSTISNSEIMQTVKNTIAENFGSAHSLAKREHQFGLENCPDQSGKVAVITGGSEGIGYGCAHTLLKNNLAKLFIIALSQEVYDGAIEDISKTISPQAAQKCTFLKCDMSDWPSVCKVAQTISDSTDRIDILCNLAARGIMTYQLTDYGLDRHMAVNHFGHVVLTSHLMPILKKTAEAGHTIRIVNMASNAHQATPSDCKFASQDELNTDLGPNGQYGRSKLAAILYSRYLARHLTSKYPKILINSTHPGFVDTKMSQVDIHEPYPILGYGMSVLMKPLKKDQWDGCVSTLYASTAVEESGLYICPPAIPEQGSSLSQDEELGEQLMKLTKEIIVGKMPKKSVDQGCPLALY